MGVTIEQYRARIGIHNNVRMEQDSTRLEVCIDFRNTMLTLLFQLIITIIMLIIAADRREAAHYSCDGYV